MANGERRWQDKWQAIVSYLAYSCRLFVAEMTTTMDEDKPAKETPVKKMGQPSAAEDGASPFPEMSLAQDIHKLTVQASGVDEAFQTKIFEKIATDLKNPSLYRILQSTLGATKASLLSEAALVEMEEANAKELADLEAKVEEAKENAGDMEVMDARVNIARFAAKSLSKEETLDSYQKLLDLPKVSSGKKIDALMESSRVASFYGDNKKSTEYIDSVSPVLPREFIGLAEFSLVAVGLILTFTFSFKGPKIGHRRWRRGLGSSQPTKGIPRSFSIT